MVYIEPKKLFGHAISNLEVFGNNVKNFQVPLRVI